MYLLFGSFRDQSATAFSKPARALRIERYKIPANQTTERLGASPGGPAINNKVDQ